MQIEYQDRIDDYLLDRMSDEERKSFESDASENAEYKEQLDYTDNVRKLVKSRSEKLALMKEWDNDYTWQDSSASSSSFKRILFWTSGIAAMLVVGFVLMVNSYKFGSPSVEMGNPRCQMKLPEALDVTFRGASDYAEIRELINAEMYEVALDSIQNRVEAVNIEVSEIVHDSTMDEETKEYNILVANNQLDELKWLHIYALLGLNRRDEAIMLLDELRMSDGFYKQSADSLYNLIRQ